MILFGALVSPFVRKVVAYCTERGLDFEPVPVGIGDPNPAFVAASPFNKMPALQDGDFAISDSSAIIHYLETKYPENGLIPAPAEARARTIWYDEFGDTIATAAAGKIFFNRVVAPLFLKRDGDEALAKQGEAELIPVFDYLESVIPPSGFLVEDRLTLADLAAVSPLVNAAHCGIAPDAAAYPKLAAYVAAITARPSFATSIARERKMIGQG